LFIIALGWVYYRHPLTDDFDRYIYEALVRARSQPIGEVYQAVKHESPRAEESETLDSPEHLVEIMPLYRIRPIYVEAIALIARWLPLQGAINLISASSFVGICIIVLAWTRDPLASALLAACYPISVLGRMGTPDALASLFGISALWLVDRKLSSPIAPIALLLVSLGMRTDNLLLLFAVIGWLAWEKAISAPIAVAVAGIGVAAVMAINRWAHNYGWAVLFRLSFFGGRAATVAHSVTIHEYLVQCARGAFSVFPQLALWILLGIVAWCLRPSPFLVVTATAALAHFLLFPSPEARYFIWAYIVTAVALISSLRLRSFQEQTAKALARP
jgi:hypothetical protein